MYSIPQISQLVRRSIRVTPGHALVLLGKRSLVASQRRDDLNFDVDLDVADCLFSDRCCSICARSELLVGRAMSGTITLLFRVRLVWDWTSVLFRGM
jgi:hypothetical protein